MRDSVNLRRQSGNFQAHLNLLIVERQEIQTFVAEQIFVVFFVDCNVFYRNFRKIIGYHARRVKTCNTVQGRKIKPLFGILGDVKNNVAFESVALVEVYHRSSVELYRAGMCAEPDITLIVLKNTQYVLLRQTLVRAVKHKRKISRLICLIKRVQVVLGGFVRNGSLLHKSVVQNAEIAARLQKFKNFLTEFRLVFLDAPAYGINLAHNKFCLQLRIFRHAVNVEVDNRIVSLALHDFGEKLVSLLIIIVGDVVLD